MLEIPFNANENVPDLKMSTQNHLLKKRTVDRPVDILSPQGAELKTTVPVVEAWTVVDMIVFPEEIG